MKKIMTLLTILLSTSVFANQTVGVGVYYKDSIYNAKKQVGVLPIINLEHKNFYIKGSNFGYTLYKEPEFKFSAIINPIGGYTDFAIRKSNFKKGFENIKTRKTQFMGGLAIDFNLDKSSTGHIEYVFGNKGSKGNLKLNKVFKITDRITFIPGINFNYFDAKYMNYYIGLDNKDTINNSLVNNTYKGKDTISAGINTTIEIATTEQFSISIFGGYEHYDSKIKKSDLVSQNRQLYVGLGLRYSF